MLVPLVVRDDGDGFELVAGFHRIAAARSLGLADVPVVIRDAETEDADRAIENITRKQLNPYEEATPRAHDGFALHDLLRLGAVASAAPRAPSSMNAAVSGGRSSRARAPRATAAARPDATSLNLTTFRM